MNYKKGDKLICIKNVTNLINYPLFIKGNTYEVLDVSDGEYLILNHILYGNEYGDFTIDFTDKNFKKLNQVRKEKLKKLNEICI